MPRDGSGNYSLPANTAAVSGETVASAPYNAFREDVKAALNDVNPQNTNTKAEATAEIATATQSGVKNISDADSPYTVVAADQGKLITVDASAGDVTINLLAAATAGNGFKIGFKRVNGEANTITVDGDGTELLDGLENRTIDGDDETLFLRCDNSNWLVTATNASGLVGTGQIGSVQWCPYDTAYPGTIMLNDTRQSFSRALYPDLWNFISTNAGTGLAASEAAALDGQFGPGDGSSTFTLPKTAGYFLRIKGGVDPDTRDTGSEQLDAGQGHRHSASVMGRTSGGGGGESLEFDGAAGAVSQNFGIGDPITDGTNGTPRVASETRPINLAWNLCIVAFQAIDDPAQLNAASAVAEQVAQAARITALESSVTWTYATPQATTSGTDFDFVGLAGAREIELLVDESSLSGSDHFLVQIGDAGGFETAGYDSTYGAISGGAGSQVQSTSGFVIFNGLASEAATFSLRLMSMSDDGTLWTVIGTGNRGSGSVSFTCGQKTLSAALSQLRLTRTGTNTFDAGTVRLRWR